MPGLHKFVGFMEEEERAYKPFDLGFHIARDRKLSIRWIKWKSYLIGSFNKMVQECCFLFTSLRRWSEPGFFLVLALLSFSDFMWCKDGRSIYSTCFKVQVHLGKIFAPVPKVSAKVSLALIGSRVCLQLFWEKWDVPIDLGQLGPILGIGSVLILSKHMGWE